MSTTKSCFIWFCEYTLAGTTVTYVDCTDGSLMSKTHAMSHGRNMCIRNNYSGFFICRRPAGTTDTPSRVEYVAVKYAPHAAPEFIC